MSRHLDLWVEGLGAWSPGLADWTAWRALLRGEGEQDESAPPKPRPACMAPGERRRVSLHVLAAIEVASQAVAMSRCDAGNLPCIFASADGDTGIMDYICSTLADAPQHLSPTRFHNSVHNAAAGYWTIAIHCRAPSQAVAAGMTTFAASLLEAAVQATTEDHPVLLVVHDEPGSGPLHDVMAIEQPFACALVLSPHATDRAVARLRLTPDAAPEHDTTPGHPHAAMLAHDNPAARGLALLEAMAVPHGQSRLALTAAPHMGLAVEVLPQEK